MSLHGCSVEGSKSDNTMVESANCDAAESDGGSKSDDPNADAAVQ